MSGSVYLRHSDNGVHVNWPNSAPAVLMSPDRSSRKRRLTKSNALRGGCPLSLSALQQQKLLFSPISAVSLGFLRRVSGRFVPLRWTIPQQVRLTSGADHKPWVVDGANLRASDLVSTDLPYVVRCLATLLLHSITPYRSKGTGGGSRSPPPSRLAALQLHAMPNSR